jgi:hypothetical protein
MFIGVLADSPFAAFRWETPPITPATASRSFVLLECPGVLDDIPDSQLRVLFLIGIEAMVFLNCLLRGNLRRRKRNIDAPTVYMAVISMRPMPTELWKCLVSKLRLSSAIFAGPFCCKMPHA